MSRRQERRCKRQRRPEGLHLPTHRPGCPCGIASPPYSLSAKGTIHREMRRGLLSLLALWLTLIAWQAPLVAAFPSPRGFVNDLAGVLSESSRAEIESRLRETEKTTTAEVVVVTVRSLDGMTVEEYAVRLFALWGIGKKATDNGVLILVSPADRAMRIEVGYGLESILPDGLAGEIIRDEFLPAFRDGNFQQGIKQGVDRVVDVVRRGEVAPPRIESVDDAPPWWLITPFFGLFVGAGSFAVGIGLKSKTFGPILWGGLFAVGPFLMSLIEYFGPATLILGALAVGMAVWGYSKGRSPYWSKTLRGSTKDRDSATGWTMGTSSSSGSDGGSSGGDFGGGSSGGGGASGRW